MKKKKLRDKRKRKRKGEKVPNLEQRWKKGKVNHRER